MSYVLFQVSAKSATPQDLTQRSEPRWERKENQVKEIICFVLYNKEQNRQCILVVFANYSSENTLYCYDLRGSCS